MTVCSARQPPHHPGMDRRGFILGSLATLAAPLSAEAQQAAKIPRIGFLWSSFPQSLLRQANQVIA